MRTRRPTMSLEGTVELIDLTHASEEEAMATLLRELRARREGRRATPAGPAMLLERDPADGASREPAGDGPGDEPAAPRPPRAAERGQGGHNAPPFSFAGLLGDVLRQMAGAPEDAPEPEMTHARPPVPDGAEERSEVEQFVARRTVIVEEDGAGKMMAAAVVGFGLGAAAMFLARRFRYVPPPSSRRERPRRPPLSPDEAAWQAQLDEIARRYADSDGDEQDDDEPSPGE